jgi:O-antigen/teichoic acid export membrane protein
MGKLKRLAGETVLYGFGSILPRFLNFLLVRLHTDAFVPEEYSIITKLFAYVAVINTLFMFGMETAYFRFANKPGADEKRIFNITQTVVIVISVLLSLLIIVLAKPIAVFLEIPSRPDLVVWLALIMFIDAVVAIPFARLRLEKKAIKFASGRIINILIFVGLNIYFLNLPPDVRNVGFVVLANLIANAFYLLFLAKSLFSWRPLYDRELTPVVFSYAYPVMLTGLAGLTNEMFSRITLERWLPENFYPGKSTEFALGVFGAAYKFAVLMNLAIQGFRYAAEPFFFSNATEKNSPQLFARVNHYFIIVCCILLVAVSVNLDILRLLFLPNRAYWEGLHIVPILLLSYLLLGVYYNFSVWFKLTDKTHYGTIITIGGAVITIVANYVLIPVAGYEGSSWAALLCYLSMTVACYILGQRYYPIPYDIGKALAYITVSMLIVYGVNAIEIPDQFLAIGFHGLVIGIYLAGIYMLERKGFRKKQA